MTGSITGTIKDFQGNVISNAHVSIADLPSIGEKFSGEFNFYFDIDAGRYSFSSLPFGNQPVTVIAPGFTPQTLIAVVEDRQTVVLDFVLIEL